jgi:hypothetical protein
LPLHHPATIAESLHKLDRARAVLADQRMDFIPGGSERSHPEAPRYGERLRDVSAA